MTDEITAAPTKKMRLKRTVLYTAVGMPTSLDEAIEQTLEQIIEETFDKTGNPISLRILSPEDETLQEETWDYNDNGKPIKHTVTISGEVSEEQTYSYDTKGQILFAK